MFHVKDGYGTATKFALKGADFAKRSSTTADKRLVNDDNGKSWEVTQKTVWEAHAHLGADCTDSSRVHPRKRKPWAHGHTFGVGLGFCLYEQWKGHKHVARICAHK